MASINGSNSWSLGATKPMPENKRKLLSKLLMPVIKYLIKLDKSREVCFTEGQRITGLYGLAKK